MEVYPRGRVGVRLAGNDPVGRVEGVPVKEMVRFLKFVTTLEPAYMVHGYKVFWHIRSVFGWSQS